MSTISIRCLTWQLRRQGHRAMVVALLALLLIGYLLVSRTGREPEVDLALPERIHRRSQTSPKSPGPVQPPPSAPTQLSVPKQLHHYFGDAVAIPSRMAQSVNSWANNHKDYDVYFWNSDYIEKRLLPSLQLYQQNMHCYQAERHTVAKLLILITFGGVIVDPDLMSLRDFASFLDGSACIVAQERPEVAALLYGLDSLPSLRFAACRQGHPFLRLFLAHFCGLVGSRTGENASSAESSTNTAIRAAFDAAVATYDDECAARVCDHRDRIVLADAGVFLPVVPAQLLKRLLIKCSTSAPAGGLLGLACQSLADPANRNLPSVISLAMSLAAGTDDQVMLPLDRIGPSVMGRKPNAYFLLPSS